MLLCEPVVKPAKVAISSDDLRLPGPVLLSICGGGDLVGCVSLQVAAVIGPDSAAGMLNKALPPFKLSLPPHRPPA